MHPAQGADEVRVVVGPELREKHQALVIEREEAIRDSEFAIASGRRLLKRLSKYRSGFLPRR